MKVLILGAGQVGRTTAYHLAREPDNEVTVVDANEAVLRDLQSRIDVRTVAGNASYPAVLESAGIADTDMLVALTSSDEVNMANNNSVLITTFRWNDTNGNRLFDSGEVNLNYIELSAGSATCASSRASGAPRQ